MQREEAEAGPETSPWISSFDFQIEEKEITGLPFSSYHFSFIPSLKGYFQKYLLR